MSSGLISLFCVHVQSVNLGKLRSERDDFGQQTGLSVHSESQA